MSVKSFTLHSSLLPFCALRSTRINVFTLVNVLFYADKKRIRFTPGRHPSLSGSVCNTHTHTSCLTALRAGANELRPLFSRAILQASVEGANPMALSDQSDSRKRTRTSLPASAVEEGSVALLSIYKGPDALSGTNVFSLALPKDGLD